MSASKGSRGVAMLLAAGGQLSSKAKDNAADEAANLADGHVEIFTPTKAKAREDLLSPTKSRPSVPHSPLEQAIVEVPASLKPLWDSFEALLTGKGLLKRRGERITYQSLAPVVERTTGKAFKLAHLQQIKHIWPEVFQWQYIRAPSLQDATKLEYQLLLTFDGMGMETAPGESSAAHMRDAAARTEFKRRLADWHQQQQQPGISTEQTHLSQETSSQGNSQVPLAVLPSRENVPRVGGSPGVSRGLNCLNSPMPSLSRPARPAPSPAISGRPPPSPTTHMSRGGDHSLSTMRGTPGSARRGSILEALNAQASKPAGQTLPTIMSPPAATQTSRQKRKADQGTDDTTPQPIASPTNTAQRALPRRRLMLGDSPGGDGDNHETAKTPSSRQVNSRQIADDEDLSPTMRARLAEADDDDDQQGSRLNQSNANQAENATPRQPQRTAFGAAAAQSAPFSPTVSTQAQGSVLPSPATSSKPRRPSLLARFMSEEAIQELRRNSETAPAAAAAAETAKKQHAVSLLPVAMDLLRAIYGTKGAVVKPREEVIELMRQKSSLESGMSSAEASLSLDLMTQHVPEYVKYVQQDGVTLLRIERSASIKNVRDKLRQAAMAAKIDLTSMPC